MELIYTKAYKLNHILSLLISGLAGVITGYLCMIIFRYKATSVELHYLPAVSVFISMHYCFTSRYRKRKKILSVQFPEEWRAILTEMVEFYSLLDGNDKYYFEKKIQFFLSEKTITGIGTDIDDRTRLLIASAAIIPVFRIEDWEYHRLNEVLVYPDRFDEHFSFTDKNRDLLGMVVQNTSSLIISRKDLFRGFNHGGWDNTAIHEFIHKIDEEDGDIDGLPALLMDRKIFRLWKSTRENEKEMIRRGESDISSYALTGEAEFFAVTGEYFFNHPDIMKEKHPDLYKVLQMIFRQDTASIIKSDALRMIKIRKNKIS